MRILFAIILVAQSLFAQDVRLEALRKYHFIQHLVHPMQEMKLSDIASRLKYINTVSDSNFVTPYRASLTPYFSSHGYSFYEFQDSPDCIDCGNYIKILAVDSMFMASEVTDPLSFVNKIIRNQSSPDSTGFFQIVQLYNKLQYTSVDKKFVEQYDSTLYGSKLNFWEFNKVVRTNCGFEMFRVIKSDIWDTEESFTVRYKISEGIFIVTETPRTRVFK
jgi:hypothetical protein